MGLGKRPHESSLMMFSPGASKIASVRRFADAVGAASRWLASVQGRRWLLRGLLAYAVVGFCVWIRRPGDFEGYLIAGDLVLAGRHIYLDAPAGVNTWPPFFSLLSVPLALLATPTPYLARGFWLLLNFACLLLVLRMIARLVYDRELSLRAETPGLSLVAPELLVPLLLPITLLFAAWRSPGIDARTRRALGIVLLASFFMGGLTSPGFIGEALAGTLEMAAFPTLSGLLVLGGCLLLRAHLGGQVHTRGAWRP